MTSSVQAPIKLFQFPRLFAIPNLSPFCCKLETWLRIAGIPYEVVDTPDPREAPKGKLPFIEDAGLRMGDTSLIIEHLVKTRGTDPDAHLDERQRARALLVQRTLEEHCAFVLLYTHFIPRAGRATHVRDLQWCARCPSASGRADGARPYEENTLVPGALAPFGQGHSRICSSGLASSARGHVGRSILLGRQACWGDAVAFAALAGTILTPIESPIRDYLRSRPACVAYTERMRDRFFPELADAAPWNTPSSHMARMRALPA